MEIQRSRLPELFSNPEKARFPVWLFFGDETLCAEAMEKAAALLVPEARKALNREVFDGAADPAGRVLESLLTLPLFPAPKVVEWRGARVFASKREGGAYLEKARAAHGEGDSAAAARYVLEFMSLSAISPEDLDPAAPGSAFPAEARGPWLDETLALCRERGLVPAAAGDDSDLLADALEKGLPQGHHLLVSAEVADKRKRLYKTFEKAGVVVDCSLPRGNRSADKEAQRQIMRERSAQMLSPLGKTLEQGAFDALMERLGPDPAGFSSALAKLAAYAGERARITERDVEALVSRSREDRIYEFTNALLSRDAEAALTILGRLLSGEIQATGAVGAAANQLRKLLAIKAFLKTPAASGYRRGMNPGAFERDIIPAIAAFDETIESLLSSWRAEASPPKASGEPAPAKGKAKAPAPKKPKAETDLFLSRGAHPFALHQTFEKAGNFSEEELLAALSILLDADRRLKSTGQNPRLIVEAAVIAVCRGISG